MAKAITETFFKPFQAHIKTIINKIVEEEAKAAGKRVEERVAREADHIVLHFFKTYSVTEMSDKLVIEVRKNVLP